MRNKYTSWGLALKIWFFTSVLFAVGFLYFENGISLPVPVLLFGAMGAGLAGSAPVLITLLIAVPLIKKQHRVLQQKITSLILMEVLCITAYAAIGGFLDLDGKGQYIYSAIIVFGALFGAAVPATFIFYPHICSLFSENIHVQPYSNFASNDNPQSFKKNTTMEMIPGYPAPAQSNKTLTKGLVAGGLILLMLIPTIIIRNLISEREARQKEVVQEVSAKWATAQTLSGPYLIVPYNEAAVNSDGKPVIVKRQLVILSKNMNVSGKIISENRPRSIYKVLLYKSSLDINGSFQPPWPADIDPVTLDLANAKLCFGLSDFKGIEEEIYINFNKQRLALSPGLPPNDISELGLSVPVPLTLESLNGGILYDMNIKLKGSERLHFMPLSANSSFALNSGWPNPSFDGNTLPNERSVTDQGFTAKWNYNQANLPFGTVIKPGTFIKQDMSFGVSMVQPADQYNKTMRSVKYAILIIGLTFALFFIVELMQDKPFHPVQYVLVGLALVIFYTLLLAISEYLLFDQAYFIASVATVTLISLYAKSHFNRWKTAAVFGAVLGTLYGFIFILLRLEDTALLVGSIGLFVVLAVVMYVSRKVDWYGSKGLQQVTVNN